MKKPKNVTFLMGHGAVSVGLSSIVGIGTYSLQSLKSPGKIGREPKKSDLDPASPEVTVYFTKVEDITREIARLQRLRRMMQKTTRAALVAIEKAVGPKCGAI